MAVAAAPPLAWQPLPAVPPSAPTATGAQPFTGACTTGVSRLAPFVPAVPLLMALLPPAAQPAALLPLSATAAGMQALIGACTAGATAGAVLGLASALAPPAAPAQLAALPPPTATATGTQALIGACTTGLSSGAGAAAPLEPPPVAAVLGPAEACATAAAAGGCDTVAAGKCAVTEALAGTTGAAICALA
ncbi:MAG TPA: hypothetical protein VKV26_20830 [Dehalococcoidia bacterium]|nr:hypothetical protein [Dehalococcoidia bacterium]